MTNMRIPEVRYEELDSDQKRVHDIIVGTRKSGLGGPFSVLVRIPHVAAPANELHNAYRLKGKLDKRLFEMLVLMVARGHTTNFAWAVHESLALKAGLDVSIVEAIKSQRVPEFLRKDEQVIFDLAGELLRSKTLSPKAFDAGREAFGVDMLIEIVSAVGFYAMVCMVLNSFGVPAPNNGAPFSAIDKSHE